MPSSRRTVLAGVGTALTGLAGCLGALDDDELSGDDERSGEGGSPTVTAAPPSTADADDAALGDAVPVDGVTVAVSEFVAADSVRYLTAPDALGVVGTGDDRFAFVRVTAQGSGSPPSLGDFALAADGTRHDPGIEGVGPARVDSPVTGRRYGDGERRGHLAVRVPAPLDATDVAVALNDRVRWSLPSSAVDALRSPPPAFSTRIDVPESVSVDEPVALDVDVTNEGDGDGVFRGAINHRGPLHAADGFELSLPAGESTTHEARIDYHLDGGSSPDRLQFGVVGPGVSRSFEVHVEGGGTPEGTATGTGARPALAPSAPTEGG